jgi:hypothetical protein
MSNDQRNYLSQIFKAYNQAKHQARRAGDQKRIDRLNKALGVLLSSNYYQDQKAAYQPSTSDCRCKDWEFRHAAKRQYTGPCKHMLAETILLTGSTEGAFQNIYSMLQFSMIHPAKINQGTLELTAQPSYV